MDKTHKLVIAACIAAMLLLLGVSAAVYSHYKHQQQAKASYSAQVSAVEAKKQENAQKVFAYQLYLLTENCKRDIAAAQTAKKPLPVCSPSLKPLQ